MKWSVPFRIGRFQICPRVAKELEAGRAVTAIIMYAQVMKRRFGSFRDPIWRLSGCKQSPERLGVTFAYGMVYGWHHRVRPREQLPEEGTIGSPGELRVPRLRGASGSDHKRVALERQPRERPLRGAIYGQRSEDEQPETMQLTCGVPAGS